jgi:hypothetical protein
MTKLGRPSKRTPANRKRLIEAAASGYSSLEAISRAAGMSADTLSRWAEDDATLMPEIESARESALDIIEKTVLTAAAEEPRLGLAVLRARRIAYNDRAKVELTGKDGGAIQTASLHLVKELSDAELRAAIERLELSLKPDAVIEGATPRDELEG